MGEEVNKRGEGPRYAPTFECGEESNDVFLGYANDLDVWYDPDEPCVCAVGPDHKKSNPDPSEHNFDAFSIKDGLLEIYNEQKQDLHIDVHDMCLIYGLCVEHGVFGLLKEQEQREM